MLKPEIYIWISKCTWHKKPEISIAILAVESNLKLCKEDRIHAKPSIWLLAFHELLLEVVHVAILDSVIWVQCPFLKSEAVHAHFNTVITRRCLLLVFFITIVSACVWQSKRHTYDFSEYFSLGTECNVEYLILQVLLRAVVCRRLVLVSISVHTTLLAF